MTLKPAAARILVILAAVAIPSAAAAQSPPAAQSPAAPQGARGRRSSPAQPQQQQGLDYFLGSWTFSWTGRESPLSSGPRSGSVTYTRLDADSAEMLVQGTADPGGAFKESGVVKWDASRKTLAFQETLANNLQIASTGDWSSPISIIVESQPVRTGAQLVRLKRTYSILSGASFRVTDEIATDGGAFVRLGVGDFRKTSK